MTYFSFIKSVRSVLNIKNQSWTNKGVSASKTESDITHLGELNC